MVIRRQSDQILARTFRLKLRILENSPLFFASASARPLTLQQHAYIEWLHGLHCIRAVSARNAACLRGFRATAVPFAVY